MCTWRSGMSLIGSLLGSCGPANATILLARRPESRTSGQMVLGAAWGTLSRQEARAIEYKL